MTYARLDLHEGDLLDIGNVPVAITWARKKRCILLVPQYESLDGVPWPMISKEELRNHSACLRISIATAIKSSKNDGST